MYMHNTVNAKVNVLLRLLCCICYMFTLFSMIPMLGLFIVVTEVEQRLLPNTSENGAIIYM